MFIINYRIIFLTLLVVSSFLALNFNSLIFSWIFIELNLLVIIPLLLIKIADHKEHPATIIKYFIIQVIRSVFIIISIFFISFNSLILDPINFIFVFIITLKSGTPPFHFWFPNIISQINYFQSIIILTIQKIIPLFLLSIILTENLIFILIISSIIGRLRGINQNILIKIIAYSSIVHFSWIVSGLFSNFVSRITYFIIYCLTRVILIFYFKSNKIKTISNIIKVKNKYTKIIFCIIIFTINGTPPFIGFFIKVFILINLIKMEIRILFIFLVISSIMSFYFYLRLFTVSIILDYKSIKMSNIKIKTINFFIFVLIFLNLITLRLLRLIG